MKINNQPKTEDKIGSEAIIPEQIVNTTPDLIYIYDLVGRRYRFANRLVADFLGYTKREILEKGVELLAAIVHPDDLDRVTRHHQRLSELKQNDVIELTHRVRHHDGSWRWLLSRDVPFSRLPGGRVEQILGIATDITDKMKSEEHRRKLDQERRQALKMEAIGKLAGGIAHDFNNLLQVIHGYSQLLLLDAEENSREKDNLTAILKAGEKAATLVQQLLFFSRKAETNKKPLNLNRQVEKSYPILFSDLTPAVSISLQLNDPLWTVAGDRLQIEQMLLNLSRNALDAMPHGGRLTITTENIVLNQGNEGNPSELDPGRYVLLTVSDTGNGMDCQTIEQIFEPFYTTKEIGQGTGLGLAAVYGIIKNHGGAILCDTELDAGTTFKIYLPAETPRLRPEKHLQANNTLVGGRETILLVDDEDPVRQFAEQIFQRFGYNVLTASSGEQALKVYHQRGDDIDLVILDIGMPGMGGCQCLQELLRFDPSAKIIVASGFSLNHSIKNPMELGALGFVPKPYDLQTILKKVRAVLDETSGPR